MRTAFALFAVMLIIAPLCVGCASSGSSLPPGAYARNPLAKRPPRKSNLFSFGKKKEPKPEVNVAMVAPEAKEEESGGFTAAFAAMGGAVKRTASFMSFEKETEPATTDPLALANKQAPGADLYVAMAGMALTQGADEQAAEHYTNALKVDPTNSAALLGFARLRDRQGRMEDARALYGRAVAAHPQDASALNDFGLCQARSGLLPESVATLNKAIALQPEKKLYRNNIAKVLVELNQLDDARDHLAHAHGQAVGNYNIGYLLAQRGRTEEAKLYFAAALEIDPTFAQAQSWMSRLEPAQVAQLPAGPTQDQYPQATQAPVQHQPYVQGQPVTAPATTGQPATTQWERPVALPALEGQYAPPNYR